ncbi:hypothetical protein LguiA_009397 [Lonicera macranthoides]
MYEPQHRVDLQDNVDPNSPIHRRNQSSLSNATTAGNVDLTLFNEIYEIVPLVQSYMERNGNSSFTRRGSMVKTKTPLAKKTAEAKGRHAAQSIPVKKRRDRGDKDQVKNADADSFSFLTSRALPTEKEREELNALREQVEDLQRKLSEKDELLKSAEVSKEQLTSVHAKLDELKKQSLEKDSLLKSTQLQLSDTKIKLADKQAALEKLQWESMTSNNKVEKLQEDLDTIQEEMSSFMLLFEGLSKNDYTQSAEDYDITPYHLDHLSDIDNLDEKDMEKIEEAQDAYMAALEAAKEKQDEESMAKAARARLQLQSCVLRTKSVEGMPFLAVPKAVAY